MGEGGAREDSKVAPCWAQTGAPLADSEQRWAILTDMLLGLPVAETQSLIPLQVSLSEQNAWGVSDKNQTYLFENHTSWGEKGHKQRAIPFSAHLKQVYTTAFCTA